MGVRAYLRFGRETQWRFTARFRNGGVGDKSVRTKLKGSKYQRRTGTAVGRACLGGELGACPQLPLYGLAAKYVGVFCCRWLLCGSGGGGWSFRESGSQASQVARKQHHTPLLKIHPPSDATMYSPRPPLPPISLRRFLSIIIRTSCAANARERRPT